MIQYTNAIICLDQFKVFGSQSLKAAVVSVAAGLRHSLAVTGKKNPNSSNNGVSMRHLIHNSSLLSAAFRLGLCVPVGQRSLESG